MHNRQASLIHVIDLAGIKHTFHQFSFVCLKESVYTGLVKTNSGAAMLKVR